MKDKDDAWEQYERLPLDYHNDPRWKEVEKLRKSGTPSDNLKANSLVFQIRQDYNFEG